MNLTLSTMRYKLFRACIALVITISFVSAAQKPIDVTGQTNKIDGKRSEELKLGFAAANKILFNFSELNKKKQKEIEILEYPESFKLFGF